MTDDERLATALELLDAAWHCEPGVYTRIQVFLTSLGWEARNEARTAPVPRPSLSPRAASGRFFPLKRRQ